jgi:predicted component of type VI protein secretion system
VTSDRQLRFPGQVRQLDSTAAKQSSAALGVFGTFRNFDADTLYFTAKTEPAAKRAVRQDRGKTQD